MCVHLCNCRFNNLILLVSVGFKTSRMMFTQRGEVCNGLEIIVLPKELLNVTHVFGLIKQHHIWNK